MSAGVDLVIAGAGPAGLALAIECARRGLSPLVLEKRVSELDKACGEGLMPPGVRALAELGVALPEDARLPFVGVRYFDGARCAEGHFRRGPGWGIRRTQLSRALLARARALAIPVELGRAVSGWSRRGDGLQVETSKGALHARTLVGADGLHSRVRRRAGLALRVPRAEGARWGMRRHFETRPWSPYVEVYWGAGVEAYVTPVGPESVGVALLGTGRAGRFEERLGAFPELVARIAGAPPLSALRGAACLHQPVRRRHAGRVVLLGDAAGYVDALTGEGLTLAFQQARALAEVLAREEPLERYEAHWRSITRSYRVLSHALLAIAQRPRLRGRVIRMLGAAPELFDRLLAINAGELPLHGLGAMAAARALAGLAVPRGA